MAAVNEVVDSVKDQKIIFAVVVNQGPVGCLDVALLFFFREQYGSSYPVPGLYDLFNFGRTNIYDSSILRRFVSPHDAQQVTIGQLHPKIRRLAYKTIISA